MDRIYNNIYKCENCSKRASGDNDHFKTHDIGKFHRHLKTTKHIKMAEIAKSDEGVVCKICDKRFTKQGYELHKNNNINLWALINNRNNHKSTTRYNEDTWKLGYKEYIGHIGENLPKCNTFKCFRKEFDTFERMENNIYKKWDKYKDKIRNLKSGALPNPWEELSRKELAAGGTGDAYDSDEWTNEMEVLEEENKERELKQKIDIKKSNQFKSFKDANFDINKIHPEGGYVLNLNLIKNTLPTETINFFKAMGFYRWDCPRNTVYSTLIELQYDYCNKDIVYSPDDINTCLQSGTFYIDNNGEQEDKVVAISFTEGNETFFKFQDYETSESEEEIVESTDSVFVI